MQPLTIKSVEASAVESGIEMNETPVSAHRLRFCAGVAAFDADQRLLLIRRKEEDAWGIPGGGVDFGESWESCAVRECLEETGYQVEVSGLLGVYSDPRNQVWAYRDTLVHFVGVVFCARIVGGSPDPAPNEVLDMVFADPDHLPSPFWSPDVPVIRDAFNAAQAPFWR